MAKAKNNSNQPTKVTRVKAKDDKKTVSKPAPEKAANTKPVTPEVVKATRRPKVNLLSPLRQFFGYFKGAWFELRMVRWPNRRATFSMTLALLIFTAIFAAFILLIDLAFENLFKLIIG